MFARFGSDNNDKNDFNEQKSCVRRYGYAYVGI